MMALALQSRMVIGGLQALDNFFVLRVSSLYFNTFQPHRKFSQSSFVAKSTRSKCRGRILSDSGVKFFLECLAKMAPELRGKDPEWKKSL